MTLTRRQFIKAGAASGGLVLVRPLSAAGRLGGAPAELSSTRSSPLVGPALMLAHADLHNHSLFSDGEGDPDLTFDSMRSAGLDVAAMTDHATLSYGLPENPCQSSPDQPSCQSLAGINEESWARTAELADRANRRGDFVAIRGFEWSSPTLGHVNVWFSERWIDPLITGGSSTGEGAVQFLHEGQAPVLPEIAEPLDDIVEGAPTTGLGMRLFYEWLNSPPDRPVVGGGLDGLAGFNHPGREPGRFSYFRFDPALQGRVVSLEIFNRSEDYLFEGTDQGAPSPLVQCLNKGWRVGLAGVTDEHGTTWGFDEGKGRTGIWLRDLTRRGVHSAMRSRRFFATRVEGLRLFARARLVPMGGVLPFRAGRVRFRLDIDRGAEWRGKPLNVQILRPGSPMPEVADAIDISVPWEDGGLIEFAAHLDVEDGRWVVLRISDPSEAADGRADSRWASFGNAVAYASPFFLDPDLVS